ncbi:hypothetical protein [Methylocystis heyeri]|uniref:Sulfur globule protein n=1 Tax=Methylocystis heyeri TaxID=391905 RepID=A0A6B8KHE1_9HYPH|nr:hypothetical protein [Methylocystis heyeri]QGM46395.1 hypothetical protein H2LOC_012205 [Methylocystis heyeri]
MKKTLATAALVAFLAPSLAQAGDWRHQRHTYAGGQGRGEHHHGHRGYHDGNWGRHGADWGHHRRGGHHQERGNILNLHW